MAGLVALLDRHNQASLSLLLSCIPNRAPAYAHKHRDPELIPTFTNINDCNIINDHCLKVPELLAVMHPLPARGIHLSVEGGRAPFTFAKHSI